MKKVISLYTVGLLVLSFFISKPILAEELKVAVASNFTAAIKIIAHQFQEQNGTKVILGFGSTGKHYAQIKNGAPFDLFLAADIRRPLLLEKEKIAISGTRYTYAQGRIVLWSPKADVVDSGGNVLKHSDINYIAIANPKLAPYGKAAQEFLQSQSLWEKLRPILVRGENISQTFQFVKSGNAELGFIAYSQIKQLGKKIDGSYWVVPQSAYKPIDQQVVLLKDTKASRKFWNFLKSTPSRNIIKSFGYGIP